MTAIDSGVVFLALGLVACGQGTPTQPTRVAQSVAPHLTEMTSVAPAPSVPARTAEMLHVSWSCFAGDGADGACRASRIRLADVGTGALITAAPTSLTQLVQGTTVTLGWGVPPGAPPASYVVEAGSTPGSSNITTFDTGSTATGLTVSNVPPGTYFVRVRGRDASGTGPASNEVTVIVTGAGPGPDPCQPRNLFAIAIGSEVALGWEGTGDECGNDRYLIQAGSAPGASDLLQVSTIGLIPGFGASGVAMGTYYIRVRSQGTSLSTPSNEVVLTVTGIVPPGTTQWTGSATNDDDDCGALTADGTLTIVQSGTSITAISRTDVRAAAGCPELVGFSFSEPFMGTATGSLADGSGTFAVTSPAGSTISGNFANGLMTATIATVGDDPVTVTLNRQ